MLSRQHHDREQPNVARFGRDLPRGRYCCLVEDDVLLLPVAGARCLAGIVAKPLHCSEPLCSVPTEVSWLTHCE